MRLKYNSDWLSGDVRSKRDGGVRAVSKEIGVSPATLSRIENGKTPDIETLAMVCQWLEKPMDMYFRPIKRKSKPQK